MSKKSLWEILIPKNSNEGIEYPTDYHRKWDEQIRNLSNGLTILKKTKGHWINSKGTVFVEDMIPVRVYCSNETIDKIIDYTLQFYNQEAVLAYEISANIKLKCKEAIE